MRKVLLFLPFFVFAAFTAMPAMPADGAVLLFNTNRSTAVFEYRVGPDKKKVVVVNGSQKNPARTVWIFHGYKPKGDPYRQSPFVFIRNWGLEKIATKNKWIFFLPDMGTSLYARTSSGSALPDMDWLHNAFSEMNGPYGKSGVPVIFIGVSTGVEGAVKLSAMMQPTVPVIALSGTFDLFSVPPGSGEYKLHRKAFGAKASVWSNENPLNAMSDGRRYTIYLFCEERSIYYDQALLLGSSGIRNIEVKNHLGLGKGFGHNWDFWGDPAVVKAVFGIIGK